MYSYRRFRAARQCLFKGILGTRGFVVCLDRQRSPSDRLNEKKFPRHIGL